MDFSKAILKKYHKEVDLIEQEIESKLNSLDWLNNNNHYKFTNEVGVDTKTKAYNFNFVMENAVIISAEIKKRFETRGWRVLTIHNGSANNVMFQLYK